MECFTKVVATHKNNPTRRGPRHAQDGLTTRWGRTGRKQGGWGGNREHAGLQHKAESTKHWQVQTPYLEELTLCAGGGGGGVVQNISLDCRSAADEDRAAIVEHIAKGRCHMLGPLFTSASLFTGVQRDPGTSLCGIVHSTGGAGLHICHCTPS